MPDLIKFYTDAHIAKAVAMQLRLRGVDIIRCQDVGMADIHDDAIHLEYATREGRTVVTCDQDFLRLHDEWQQQGKHHAGIVYVLPENQNNIGKMVTELLSLHELIAGEAGNLQNDVYDSLQRIS